MTTKEQATEFQRRRNLPSVEVRHIFGGARCMDVMLYCRDRGKYIGSMAEIKYRTKTKRTYSLPEL